LCEAAGLRKKDPFRHDQQLNRDYVHFEKW